MTTGKELVPAGAVARQDFGGQQIYRSGERETAAVQAREQATIMAEYVAAERHPRIWADVRAAMLDHCSRPRFAESARYSKPIGYGRNPKTGEMGDLFAVGFSARFAETLRQEMGNMKTTADCVYEDDEVIVQRFGVTDLQKNNPRSRQVSFPKQVEKRGKKIGKGNAATYDPPAGRAVLGERVNSYGDLNFIVRATKEEMRNIVNSEESKTQRDLTLAMCPKDILEDCEDVIEQIIVDEIKLDPRKASKTACDLIRKEFGIMPSDLERYIGRTTTNWTPADIVTLRGLYTLMRDSTDMDGAAVFEQAMADRYADTAHKEATERDLTQQRDMEKQGGAADTSAPPEKSAGAKPDGTTMAPPWENTDHMRLVFGMLRAQMSIYPGGDQRFHQILASEGSAEIDELVLNHQSSLKTYENVVEEIEALKKVHPAPASDKTESSPAAAKPGKTNINLGKRNQ